ncbi:DUF6415 family natural product biosynthesis protein [Streptomyces sp. H27-H1]|uniref:DUF6415 family natural product biosynthesis protein n=1 Tax=Streptomyces sp. H27-H1 TaxID=2996461 RepID=UPI0022717BA1|nr:DUF6415 family natural product biosynthesis protein [Streptomyces sp. H27-H1]MCY0930772.1 DUF6415 family natural product biosynthesis protein [Streptomyces sp. H27-H1]
MRPEAHRIDELVQRALRPYDQRPDAEGVAHLVDDLITAGQELHALVSANAEGRRTERATAALAEWSYFLDKGPLGHSDHANWNHARGLARIIRTMAEARAEQRPAGVR